MAINYLNSINLNQNELIKGRIENQANDGLAGTGVEGQLYYNTTEDVLKVWAGGAWVEVGGGVITLTAGTYLTDTGTAEDPIINHDNTSRTDTTSTDTPAYGGTFDAVTSVSTNATGHVTAIDVSTVTIPSAYTFNVTADEGGDQTISSGNTLDIAGGTNISTVVGNTDTVTVNLDDSVTLAGELTVEGTGQSSFAGQVTIPQIPSSDTDAASKHYVDQAVTGALSYQGGYNASTNTPDLTTSPNSIKKGFTYTVTASGTFFGEKLEVGDVLIAEIDNPTDLNAWTTVQNNVDLADLITVGIGNVNAGAGISVAYSAGTATVTNEDKNSDNTDSGQITAGQTSGTVNHGFNTTNVIVQTYLDNATENYPTVFCDITRSASSVTATVASAQTDNIIILVQKIG
jgi:hypothetical protein